MIEIGTYLSQSKSDKVRTSPCLMDMYQKIMKQKHGVVKVNKKTLADLIRISGGYSKMIFRDQIYTFDNEIYSEELKELQLSKYSFTTDEDKIELSYEDIRLTFYDVPLVLKNFYQSSEFMEWYDMDMVKKIINKFNILSLLNQKIELKDFSLASLCCVHYCLKFCYPNSNFGSIKLLKKIISIECVRKLNQSHGVINNRFYITKTKWYQVLFDPPKYYYRYKVEQNEMDRLNNMTDEEWKKFKEEERKKLEEEEKIERERLAMIDLYEGPNCNGTAPCDYDDTYCEDYDPHDDLEYLRELQQKREYDDYIDNITLIPPEPEWM